MHSNEMMLCEWANRRVPVSIFDQLCAARNSVPLEKREGEDRELETEPTHPSERLSKVLLREQQALPIILNAISSAERTNNDIWERLEFMHKTTSKAWVQAFMLKLVKEGRISGRKVPSRSGPTWLFRSLRK